MRDLTAGSTVAKYKELAEELKKRKTRGDSVVTCFACDFEAALESEIVELLFNQNCLVCESSTKYLKVDCPKCGANISLTDPAAEKCPKCYAEIEPDQLAENNKEINHHEEKIGETAIASCGECEGYETVAQINGTWICFSCLETFDSVDECEWCGQKITGDSENTYLNGCMHCSGMVEWNKDE